MVTPQGRAHITYRLSIAPDLDALERVWSGVGDEYRRDDEIKAHYLRCKRGFL